MNVSKHKPTSTLSIGRACKWPHPFSLLDECCPGEMPLTMNIFCKKITVTTTKAALSTQAREVFSAPFDWEYK